MSGQVSYLSFMKHAEKVSKTANKARPVLSTIYHSDKHVAVTDGHRLYVATGVYDGEEKTINPATGIAEDNGKYPNVERFLMTEDSVEYSQEIDVNAVYDTVRAIEIANRVTRGTTDLIVGINDEEITVSTTREAGFSVCYPIDEGRLDLSPVKLETKYLREALHVLRDSKVDKAVFSYAKKNYPIQITAGNFTAIVMPKGLPEDISTGRVVE